MTQLPTDPVVVTLDGITHAGEGVGRVHVDEDGTATDGSDIGGKVVFVPGGIPGERVRIRVVDDRRSWARAELVDVVEASPDRVEPPCPYAPFGADDGPACGGCQLQHVADTRELELKERIVIEQLERIGKLDDPPVEPIRAVGPPLNYRLSARFHATSPGGTGARSTDGDAAPVDAAAAGATDDAGPAAQGAVTRPRDEQPAQLGFYAARVGSPASEETDTDPDSDAGDVGDPGDVPGDPGGDAVRAIDRCIIVNEDVQGLREQTGDAGGASQISFRAVPSTGTRGMVLHPGAGGLQLPAVEADVGLAEPGGVKMMRGDGVLRSTVAGITYHFGLSCFFQPSEDAATALLDEVRLEVGDSAQRTVWDLYAGVGLFAVALAADGAEVVAVESHGPAVDWLRRNAEDNGVHLVAVDEDVAEWVEAGGARPDVVVLDPPRGGAGLEVVRALARLRVARIVYVSCDVPAFARDAGDLVDNGYRLERVQPLDCFPQTRHIELVGTLSLV